MVPDSPPTGTRQETATRPRGTPRNRWDRRQAVVQFTFPTHERSAGETFFPYRPGHDPPGEEPWRTLEQGEREAMKLVVAIIKPHQVESVTSALDAIEVSGMTLTEVRGHGQQRGHSEVYRGGEYKVDFLPKVRIEVLVADGKAEQVANTIVDHARTGKIGDGKRWIQPVDLAVRIRTGEVGDEAV